MRPRVFVSSVMEEFSDFRQAARKGIIAAGGEPVLIEDFPATSASPRTACLDAVASCDACVIIVGEKGGWKTPAGRLVVEEEFEEARKRKLSVLVFLHDKNRDEDAQRLVDRLSDYVDGMLRPSFNTATELQSAVANAVDPLVRHHAMPEVNMTALDEKLKRPYRIDSETALRFVVAPQRKDEVIDPISLESSEFEQQIYEMAHSPDVKLLSFKRPKSAEVGIHEIVVLQSEEGGRREAVDTVRLELTTGGAIIIDLNVTGKVPRDFHDNSLRDMVILEADVTEGLRRCFGFASAFYETKDPFKRYDRMVYNATLSGMGYRKLVSDVPKGNSITMNMSQYENDLVVAFDEPRLLTREDLRRPDTEIQATLSLFRRRLK